VTGSYITSRYGTGAIFITTHKQQYRKYKSKSTIPALDILFCKVQIYFIKIYIHLLPYVISEYTYTYIHKYARTHTDDLEGS